MKEYFEAEMRQFLETAQEFADAYPEQAAMLNLHSVKDRDPYVERLLEGMAYLTAHVRQRIDDSVPELSEALLNQLIPALCRPYPSHVVIEATPDMSKTGTVSLPRNSTIRSIDVILQAEEGKNNKDKDKEKYAFTFTTTDDANIVPLTVSHLNAQQMPNGSTQLEIHIRRNDDVAWTDIDLSALNLYIHSDWPLAYCLYELFNHPSTLITCTQNSSGRVSCNPINLQQSKGMLPETAREHAAYHLLHDYFCARERFLFIQLNLQPDSHDLVNPAPEESVIILKVNSPVELPAGHNLKATNLRLNCVPAINLFPAFAEPINLNLQRAEYSVKVDKTYHNQAQVYAVTAVTARDTSSGKIRTYHPLHAMRYRHRSDCTYAELSRISSVGERHVQLQIDQGNTPKEEILSTDVLASEGQFPRRYIDLGQLNEKGPLVSPDITLSNITRPSRMLFPPANQDTQWQLVSFLSGNLSALNSPNALHRLLSLFDWSDQIENRNRIISIESLTTETRHRMRQGALSQVVQLTLEINEKGFSSRSDLFLFASMLHHFFSAMAKITEFVETRVIALPSYKEWTWAPSIGQQPLL